MGEILTVSSDQLWSGVTFVSSAGKKRGRGRTVKRRVNLNAGQRLGYGIYFVDFFLLWFVISCSLHVFIVYHNDK